MVSPYMTELIKMMIATGACNQFTAEQVRNLRQKKASGENSNSTPPDANAGSEVQVLQPILGLRDWSVTKE
jgi:hypothetical protein